ncbi:MAG: preprotein translocase subunit SecE [Gammaproteobacteria bacterium]|nr:preprotein translocase subunit SecE [Gammaproteobacteria bacterium]
MSTRVETVGGMPDVVKWLVAACLVLAGLAGFYIFGDQSLLLRVIALLLLFGAAIAVAYHTAKGREGAEFVKDARVELRKVVWPTRQETTQTTLVVIVMVAVVALMLWILDSVLGLLIKQLLSVGG